jgi:hypothetical protein
LCDAQDVDYSLEGVSQAREAKCSANILEPLHVELPRIIGVFDRATGVCNAWLALLHELRAGFEPFLHTHP